MRSVNFFRFIAPTALVLWYLGLAHRLVATAFEGAAAVAAMTLLALPFLAMLWLPLVYWRSNRRMETRAQHLGLMTSFASIGYMSLLLCVVGLRDAAALVAWVSGGSLPLYGPRATGTVLGLTAVFTLLGFYEARRTPRIRRIDVPLAGLPPEWNGLTIAQVSDLHVGHTIRRRFVERVVRALERAAPDAIAVTGDLADGRPEQLLPELEPFRRLAPPLGTFYVTGNHEFYWGAEAWLRGVETLGWRPLANAHVVLRRGGVPLVMAGVNDYIARLFPGAVSDPNAAFEGAPAGATRILLAHQPRLVFDAERLGVALQLSGHTHGGQFLPWVFLVGFFNPVTRGLRRFGKTWIYVSAGTGYWGPPIRLGAPAEITLLKLTA